MKNTLQTRTRIALVILLAASCSRSATGPDGPAGGMTLSNGRPAVLLVDNPQAWPHDSYQFRESRLNGDTLEVTITHGGGCATHEYALLVNPAFLESYPVQMNGSLAHDAKTDPCRALLSPTLRFDLAPLKQAYRNAYQTQSGVISLRIRDWPHPIEYRF